MGISAFVGDYIWQPPQAVTYMLLVYVAELLTDLIVTATAGQLTRQLALNRLFRFLFTCLFVAGLLAIATGAARWGTGFGWFPPTLFFTILSGLILLIVQRAARLGVLNPLVADLLEVRFTGLLNQQKNETSNNNSLPGLPPTDPAQS